MINTGDTAFVLISAALVLIMTPGLAFFYGGLVNRRNVVAIMAQSFVSMGVVTIIWVLVGFSLAFSGGKGGFIGNLDWFGLRGVGARPDVWAPHIPALAFFAFQLMFAVITPALISGAFVGRVRFRSYLLFLVGWSLLVYIPLVHWIWGGGFLARWGVLDFAGGMVVHASAGFAALASVLVLGQRQVTSGDEIAPSSVVLVAIGTGLLWFGWFGFNAGSALAANGVAAQAFVNTAVAAAVAMCTWGTIAWVREGKPSLIAGCTGAVVGLACVTPCAGFVPTWAALVIGVVAGIVCFAASLVPLRRKWDDALEVWAAHGIGGVLGTMLLGLFAEVSIDAAGHNGLFAGGGAFFGKQVVASLLVAGYSFVLTWLILKFLNLFEPVRADAATESAGLDSEFVSVESLSNR